MANARKKLAVDPMFEAIEANRSAVAALTAVSDNATDEEFDRLGRASAETWERLVRTTPTTVAGLLAFMTYARTQGTAGAFVDLCKENGNLEAWRAVERMIKAVA